MLGVVPLGTGNDMARVMGWGAQFGDEEKLPVVLREMECSSFHLLDRWSVQYSHGDVDMSPIAQASTVSVEGRGNRRGERMEVIFAKTQHFPSLPYSCTCGRNSFSL